MPTVRKARAGVSFDRASLERVDRAVKELKSLGVNRSEVINALVAEFLEERQTTEAVWEAVAEMRRRKRG